jgi:hypothetical protein
MTHEKADRPWVELLFVLVVGFSAAAFGVRGAAYARWQRGEPMGSLGPLAWVWTVAAFIPFLVLVVLAPNPELSMKAPRKDRRRQILMFIAILVIFGLEVFLLTF